MPSMNTTVEDSRSALPSGTLLDEKHYEIIGSELGRGGFAITYKALDKYNGELVAIKELFIKGWKRADDNAIVPGEANLIEDWTELLRKFKDEARILASLKHPNIVRILWTFEERQTAYLVMPLLGGVTLAKSVGNKRYTETQAIKIIRKVSEALGFLHSKRVVHGDVNPSNIVVTNRKSPTLIDFGLAHLVREFNPTDIRGGTKGFVPPEMAQGTVESGYVADIYGLAATCYFMVTGMAPGPEAELAGSLSKELRKVLRRALNPEPSERPKTITELLELLDPGSVSELHYISDTSIAARPSSASTSLVTATPAVGDQVIGLINHHDTAQPSAVGEAQVPSGAQDKPPVQIGTQPAPLSPVPIMDQQPDPTHIASPNKGHSAPTTLVRPPGIMALVLLGIIFGIVAVLIGLLLLFRGETCLNCPQLTPVVISPTPTPTLSAVILTPTVAANTVTPALPTSTPSYITVALPTPVPCVREGYIPDLPEGIPQLRFDLAEISPQPQLDPYLLNFWGRTGRTALWGPGPNSREIREHYEEGRGGEHEVVYFDKGRMEKPNPVTRPDVVKSGLLVFELLSGHIQMGDDRYAKYPLFNKPMLGKTGPTYASFQHLADTVDQQHNEADHTGPNDTEGYANKVIGPDGVIYSDDSKLGAHVEDIKLLVYNDDGEHATHNVPRAFCDFLMDIISKGTKCIEGQETPPVLWEASGVPISEPYWTTVKIGNVSRTVMFQAFERRVLMYEPEKPADARVSVTNVGQDYFDWRYPRSEQPACW